MEDDQVRVGTITKVVHLRFAANPRSDGTNLDGSHGYGILQGSNGKDVFFVDSALQDAHFSDLQAGQEAHYVVEFGPLGRAEKVWVATGRPGDARAKANVADKTTVLNTDPRRPLKNRSGSSSSRNDDTFECYSAHQASRTKDIANVR